MVNIYVLRCVGIRVGRRIPMAYRSDKTVNYTKYMC